MVCLLHVTEKHGFFQTRQRVPLRDELLRYVAFEAGIDNGFHHRRIVDLLRLVDLVPTGVTARMVVPNVLMILANGPDDVTFHDLHVVDIIQQLEVVRPHTLAEVRAPGGMIAHVILVIHLAVEQFHDHGYTVLLGAGHQPLQPHGTVGRALLVAHTPAITRETDHSS